MSRNSKSRRKKALRKQVTAVRKAGGRIGRTQKLHRKAQVYPKTPRKQVSVD